MSAGLLVAFESSTRRPSVALAEGDQAPVVASLDGERSHARDLLPALERLLAEGGYSARDIGALAVGTGPGSFTGLRVGVATALGLERSLGVPVLGLPSMAAAVFDHLARGEVGGQLLDARGGRLYTGAFRRDGDTLTGVLDVCAPRPSELVERLSDPAWGAAGAARLFVDPAARRAAGEALDDPRVAPSSTDGVEPDASAVLRLARPRLARGEHDEPGTIRPLYLARFGE